MKETAAGESCFSFFFFGGGGGGGCSDSGSSCRARAHTARKNDHGQYVRVVSLLNVCDVSIPAVSYLRAAAARTAEEELLTTKMHRRCASWCMAWPRPLAGVVVS